MSTNNPTTTNGPPHPHYSTTVALRGIKDPGRRAALTYEPSATNSRQPRHAGRVTLVPTLDLSDYTCRAVIDWIDVVFSLKRRTQFRFLQADLMAITGRKSLVEPVAPGPGGVETHFRVRFQEPRLRILSACVEMVEACYGLVVAPTVTAAEFSVDFTPRIPTEESRASMVGLLTRHLFPNRDFTTIKHDRPRFNWGMGSGKTRHVLRSGDSEMWDYALLASSECDEQPPIDATYYVGRKGGAAMWRLMEKVTDQRNPEAGTRISLPDETKRARVEVTLNKDELTELGIETLTDLQGFNFAKLQGRYFRFMLPTFAGQFNGARPAAMMFLERERWERFLKAGVIGLVAMDEARQRLRDHCRPALIQHLSVDFR